MTERTQSSASPASRIVSALEDLIKALDSRVPHMERAGEVWIAREAQLLRREAVARIEDMKRAGLDEDLYDDALVDAIMTDDGGPPLE